MRAAVMRAIDADRRPGQVVVEELADPVPRAPNDVIVRIAGAGVCRTDLHILRGEVPVEVPHVLGHENAGRVAAVGPAVTLVSPGDPVLCYPFLSSGLSRPERSGLGSGAPERITPGIDAPGGFAEYLRSNERAMVPLPHGTDPAPLAPLTDAGLAAYRACRKAARSLRPGDTAVVVGAGGLGHLGIQILAELTPARIVAVDVDEKARTLAERCGAHTTCTPGELGDCLDGARAAAVLDFVGADDTTSTSLEVLAFGGHYLVVGVGGDIRVPTTEVVAGEQRIEGVYVGTYAELTELTALALEGRVVPRVVTYPLDEADGALRDLENGNIVGRAVLVP